MVAPKLEVVRTWRVWLTGSKPHYEDVVGVRPMVDERGMLAFLDMVGNLAALFATGSWAVVRPGALVVKPVLTDKQEEA